MAESLGLDDLSQGDVEWLIAKVHRLLLIGNSFWAYLVLLFSGSSQHKPTITKCSDSRAGLGTSYYRETRSLPRFTCIILADR